MDTTLSLSFTPGEIVSAGTVLEVRTERALDARSAQGAVALFRDGRRIPVTTSLANRRRSVRIPTDGLAPGTYRVIVGELLDARGAAVAEPVTVSFIVGALRGEVPADHRVEHAVHLAVGEVSVDRLSPGDAHPEGTRYVEMVKSVHRQTGEPREWAFDEHGKPVDAASVLSDLARRRGTKYGRLHEVLYDRLETATAGDRIDVVVWPRLDHDVTDYPKPDGRAIEASSKEPQPQQLRIADATRRAASELAQALTAVGAKEPRPLSDRAPAMHVRLTVEQIRELAAREEVGVIFLDDRVAINDLADSIAVAHSDAAHNLGFDGTGVKVAVFEDGPSVTTNLSLAGRYQAHPPASDHARLTHAVVKNTEKNKPHGHAPDCDLYSANSGDNAALHWAVDQGCTVISQSFHRSSEPGGSGLQADDLLKDYLALHPPYPTIVQAAGNFWQGDADDIHPPSDEYVNHKGFNTLSIGNHDDAAAAMSGDSVFRNPASAHGDRELPELAANGTGVSANGQTMSGTSFAAPAVAGVTALLQDVDSTLASWPEGCRAILLAAAGRNVNGRTWWNDVASRTDASDGSGALDAESGVRIAQQRRFRNAPATSRGWDVGTLASADFSGGLTTFRYRVSVPQLLFSPHVKVALAWDSKVQSFLGIPLSSTLTVDFDLIVRNSQGVQVASSASWDNSYEIAEFDATRGATYEILVRRWSGTDSVWFGIAWAVTGISFPIRWPVDFPLELSRLQR